MMSNLHPKLKPKIRNISGRLDASKPARIQISLFNEHCSGAYLQAICDWLSEKRATVVEFQVADSLQRHNLWWRESIDSEASYANSLRYGDRWLEQNRDIIFECFKRFSSCTVSRWDYWTGINEYGVARSKVDQVFASDQLFEDIVRREAEQYFLSAGRTPKEDRVQSSIDFLLEEAAVSEASQSDSPANEIYPGKEFTVEKYLRNLRTDKFALCLRSVNQIYLQFE